MPSRRATSGVASIVRLYNQNRFKGAVQRAVETLSLRDMKPANKTGCTFGVVTCAAHRRAAALPTNAPYRDETPVGKWPATRSRPLAFDVRLSALPLVRFASRLGGCHPWHRRQLSRVVHDTRFPHSYSRKPGADTTSRTPRPVAVPNASRAPVAPRHQRAFTKYVASRGGVSEASLCRQYPLLTSGVAPASVVHGSCRGRSALLSVSQCHYEPDQRCDNKPGRESGGE